MVLFSPHSKNGILHNLPGQTEETRRRQLIPGKILFKGLMGNPKVLRGSWDFSWCTQPRSWGILRTVLERLDVHGTNFYRPKQAGELRPPCFLPTKHREVRDP